MKYILAISIIFLAACSDSHSKNKISAIAQYNSNGEVSRCWVIPDSRATHNSKGHNFSIDNNTYIISYPANSVTTISLKTLAVLAKTIGISNLESCSYV